MLTCKILIVDDDPDDRDIFQHSFHQIGVQPIHTVPSARDAIAFLQAIPRDEDLPALIITDLNMPGMSGIGLLQTLKEMHRYARIPVIVCSTSSSAQEAQKCLRLGAIDYITKPSLMTEYVTLTQKMSRLALC